jgi:mannose-6-phosphate isomerase-like protein (cupin superfamily)
MEMKMEREVTHSWHRDRFLNDRITPGKRRIAMSGYSTNIEAEALENNDFRRVLFTGPFSQLVLMTLQPGEEIGIETHTDRDQFFRVEAGSGEAIIDGEHHAMSDGTAVVVPAGTEHNVINLSATEPLRLYTIYSPAEHPDGTVNKTKADADAYEHSRHGLTDS